MDKNIFIHIVNETNQYAKNYLEEHNEKAEKSYLSKWMKKIFGLVILIIHKLNLHMSWSIDELHYTPLSSKVMTCHRFFLLKNVLHFNDNLEPNYKPNGDK